jgi:hypothetical protein
LEANDVSHPAIRFAALILLAGGVSSAGALPPAEREGAFARVHAAAPLGLGLPPCEQGGGRTDILEAVFGPELTVDTRVYRCLERRLGPRVGDAVDFHTAVAPAARGERRDASDELFARIYRFRGGHMVRLIPPGRSWFGHVGAGSVGRSRSDVISLAAAPAAAPGEQPTLLVFYDLELATGAYVTNHFFCTVQVADPEVRRLFDALGAASPVAADGVALLARLRDGVFGAGRPDLWARTHEEWDENMYVRMTSLADMTRDLADSGMGAPPPFMAAVERACTVSEGVLRPELLRFLGIEPGQAGQGHCQPAAARR